MLTDKNQNSDDSEIEEGEEVSEHEESSEFINVKYAGRKNFCDICNNILAKYTCPKCQLKTCSLVCTKKHKDIKNCSGERQATQYLSKDEITPKAVEKDYNFIEDMISGADKVKKVLSGVNNTINLEPRRFKILRNNARQLYNIKLSNGPNILQRHRDNISFFFVKTKSIYWVFQLLYFQGKSNIDECQKILTSRVLTQPTSDQKSFIQLLPQDYLDKTLLERKEINTTKRQQFLFFLQNKQRINENTTQEQIEKRRKQNSVLGEKLVNGKFVTYYELIQYDASKKVSQQMTNISLFEFPTLYVVHNTLRDEFIQSYRLFRFRNKHNTLQHPHKHRDRQQQRQRSREKHSKKRSQKKQQKHLRQQQLIAE